MSTLDVQLLRALRASSVHLPGADLASQLGVELSEIEHRLAELRAAGFEIEQRPGLGHRLLSAPDRIIADDLTARLGPCALVREIVVYEETDSTNDRAAQLGAQGVAGGVAIFAERQSAGRGRFGRRWESASHRGLWFSLLLRPELSLPMWPRLTTWCAVALAAAIEAATGLRTAIKWPNDIQIDSRKICGVLVETGFDRSGAPFAVAGIGVNVNHEPDDFPPELAEKAGSLHLAAGRILDRAALAVAILRALDAHSAALAHDFPALVAEAARRSMLLGRWIEVRAAESVVVGIAERLDADGQLLLRTADGELRTLNAGEVTLAPASVS